MQVVVRVDAVTCQAGRADTAGEAALQLAQVLNAAGSAGAAFAQIYSVSVESTPGCLAGLLGKRSTYQQVDLAVCAPRSGASAPPEASDAPFTEATIASTQAPAVDEPGPSSNPAEAFRRIPGINPSAGDVAGSKGGIQGKWVLAAIVGGLVLVTLLSNLFSSRPAAPSAAAVTAPAVPATAAPAAAPVAPAGPQALNSAWFGTWRSASGSIVTTFDAGGVHEKVTVVEEGKPKVYSSDYPWTLDITQTGTNKRYSAYKRERINMTELTRQLEDRLKPDVDYTPPPAEPARRAVSSISPGVYKVVTIFEPDGDCGGGDFIVDGTRMLRWMFCKYGTGIELLTKQ
jgi:hypothetical protein